MNAAVRVLAILLPACCLAQAPGGSVWPQEPTAFLKVEFGKPVEASYPACPRMETAEDVLNSLRAASHDICVKRHLGSLIELDNVVGHLPFYPVYITEIDGIVEGVTAEFGRGGLNGENGETVRNGLIEKYGAPHRRFTEQLRTRGGVDVERETLIWRGDRVTIQFESVGSNIEKGDIEVFTESYRKSLHEQKDGYSQDLKSAF